MAKAFNDRTNTSDINFGSTSYISNSDNWKTVGGTIDYGSSIHMGSESSCDLNKSFSDMKCNYVKLKVHLTADDKSLSTDNFHAVSCRCDITTTDRDNKKSTKTYNFYPKYDFEDTYSDDYTTFKLGDNVKLNNIKLTLVNDEDLDVKIADTGLYVSKVVDEEAIKDEVIDTVMEEIEGRIPEIVQESLEEGTMDLVIPLIYDISEMQLKPDGAIARCAWVMGVEYSGKRDSGSSI